MERSDSTSSNGSARLRHNSALESGQFAYQKALLERTSSRTGTLSRASSRARDTLLTTPTGNSGSSSATPNATRRWTPSHRVGGSLDISAVRGKWEERSRAAEGVDSPTRPSALDRTRSEAPTPSPVRPSFETPVRARSIDRFAFPPASPARSETGPSDYSPSPPSKRYTLPAPIIASPLSPNTTGVSVVVPDSPTNGFSTPEPQRIHLPVSTPLASSSVAAVRNLSSYTQTADTSSYTSSSVRLRRSNTLESINPNSTGSSVSSENSVRSVTTNQTTVPNSPESSTTALRRRPTSLYGDRDFALPSPEPTTRRPLSSMGMARTRSSSTDKPPGSTSVPPSPSPASPSNPMFPSQYRSSYLMKKRGMDHLGTGTSVRRLERIASGDAPDDWPGTAVPTDEPPPPPPPDKDRFSRREDRLARTRDWRQPSPERLSQPLPEVKLESFPEPRPRPELVIPGVTNADDVVGVPRRKRLLRDTIPSNAPLPSSRLTRGLWADVQRHLIQAYEYLCHVGEAKEWIEGCLGEELPFGVVEMEEQLRNGVVLAKLVRVFMGEGAVRKIYEAPKLDFRHSDNINHFFAFVRHVGLPEGFIFELTDLYEKKNFPKVIYCIHALSHLLARRGLARRIGNLVGQLQFSDDQLQKTQRGLKEAGVPMPNFGNVGRELAKEINEEPEEEPETEDERRDRMLLECEDSIVALQAAARAFLVRKDQVTQRARMRMAERYVPKVQAVCRAALLRKRLQEDRKERRDLSPFAIALQAHARGSLARRQWKQQLRMVKATVPYVVKIQAQSRGVIVRRKYQKLRSAIQSCKISVLKLQSVARARIAQRSHKQIAKSFAQPVVLDNIVALQAQARGALLRARLARQDAKLARAEPGVVSLQAQVRGVLVRRRVRTQLAKLDDVSDVVVRIQAAVRTYLARKRLLNLIRSLRKATPALVGLQAIARAKLARQQHHAMHRALSEVKVVKAVGIFQARARAALARSRHEEQKKKLEFVEPDVVGFQATARGYIVRLEWLAWRDFLRSSHPQATMLQALLRGVLQRKKFREKMQYYRSNLDKIVQIQSLFRAKETREQYRQLTLGTNVSVGTIKNFVHLLDDSEADFQEEIKVERLRQEVVKRIRENQALEHDLSDLDVRIALVVQNVKNFEDLVKARRRLGADSAAIHAARASVLAAHGDPFASPSTLDRTAKRKLELYQQLFYLLQTDGKYITRLFGRMSADENWEKNRRMIERVVLTLFGYGQAPREEYLLLKFFQTAVHEEVAAARAVEDVIHAQPTFINVAVHYLRPKQTAYIRDTLQGVIREVIKADDLDLETDPCVIYRKRVDRDETRGKLDNRPKDVAFHQALQDPDTRAEYIRHLQVLQWWTEEFVRAITLSLNKMPYGMRYMARETLNAVKEKFPDAPAEACAACVARLVYYRYINPAIITPETFDIVPTTIDIESRKNLAQISKMLTQITSGAEFSEDSPAYLPVNDYVRKTIATISTWLMEVANVPDAETEFHAHEFLDATIQPRPIWISPNEVYSMHRLLSQHLDHLAPPKDDTLRVILTELDGVPNVGSEELNEARDTALELQLSNRFARVKDPRAEEKALWVQAKRAVLAILRVQPAKDLVESLMQPVTDNDEFVWEGILEETERDVMRHQRRMPSTTGADSAYRLEDIRSMTFREVKAHAIYFLLELEKQGKITRMDGYQGILNAIAGDVRSKNRRRVQRLHERESLEESLKHLAERKKYFEEQIKQYHDYVETAMNTMQRGKGKRRLLPFTKQYFHMRELQQAGKMPQFGSFKYSAQRFYDKGILLSIENYSPRQFDKLDIVLSSNAVGVFTIEMFKHALGITNRMASADVKMEELLQAQFDDRASFSLFDGLAKFNLNLLLWQINKKFYR